MDQATPSTASSNTLHCALELSKKSWLLAIQFPDRVQPSLDPIAGGDAERLKAGLTPTQDPWATISGDLRTTTTPSQERYHPHLPPLSLNHPATQSLVV